jgi:opacity protein-like surface antigen
MDMTKKKMPLVARRGKKTLFMPRRGRLSGLLMALILVSAAALSANASEAGSPQSREWQFGADIYLWMIELGGETAGGENIDVPFHDILDNLDFAFLGALHARNGRWHLSADVNYMDLEGDNSNRLTLPGGNDLKSEVTVTTKSWVVTPAVGYEFINTKALSMEALAGARYLYLKPELDFDITGPLNSRGRTISDSGDVWDGIAGIRGEVNLAEAWYILYCADLGAGDSDLTWQALAGVGCRLGQSADVVAAYRYVEWQFEDNKVLDSLDISGPLVGLRFRF